MVNASPLSSVPLAIGAWDVRFIQNASFMAQIGGDRICGGTILAPLLVLTAAHCALDHSSLRELNLDVIAGQLEFGDPRPGSQSRSVVGTIRPHPAPAFTSYGVWTNDVIILQLNESLQFNDKVQSVDMTLVSPTCEGKARIYGWGLTEEDRLSPKLRQAKVTVMPTSVCQLIYPNQTEEFVDKMGCARGYRNEATCQGDSGSPVFCLGPPMRFFGVTAFGESGECSSSMMPPAYVHVFHYMEWIQRTIREFYPEQGGKCPRVKDFACANGQCIPKAYMCDRDWDCDDGSDEANCPGSESSPSPGQEREEDSSPWFSCRSTWRIPRTRKCDGILDCRGGVDELGCRGCSEDEIWCGESEGCHRSNEFCYFTSAMPNGICLERNVLGMPVNSCNALDEGGPPGIHSVVCSAPITSCLRFGSCQRGGQIKHCVLQTRRFANSTLNGAVNKNRRRHSL